MKYKEYYENEYFRNILSTNKNCCIYSDEPYEFRIIGGTPDGRIIIPNQLIYAPCHVKRASVRTDSVIIKNSIIESIKNITKCNNNYIEVTIKYIVSFSLKIYDKYNHLYKIRCYLDKYPMPNKQSFIKDFIRAYSIVTTKLLINLGNKKIYKRSHGPKVQLCNKAYIEDVKCKYCKEKKYISFYDVNCEEYIKIFIGITIFSKIKISLNKKICII